MFAIGNCVDHAHSPFRFLSFWFLPFYVGGSCCVLNWGLYRPHPLPFSVSPFLCLRIMLCSQLGVVSTTPTPLFGFSLSMLGDHVVFSRGVCRPHPPTPLFGFYFSMFGDNVMFAFGESVDPVPSPSLFLIVYVGDHVRNWGLCRPFSVSRPFSVWGIMWCSHFFYVYPSRVILYSIMLCSHLGIVSTLPTPLLGFSYFMLGIMLCSQECIKPYEI